MILNEALFEKPSYVIDFLPDQVPEGSAGQFFAVERLYLRAPRQAALRRRFAEILLKLNCYDDLEIGTPEGGDFKRNPAPETLAARVEGNQEDLCVLLPGENALITLNRDDPYMTVYNPAGALLRRIGQLAAAEGLFIRPTAQEEA